MSRIRIAPIVEGHGEVQAIRILLDRVWREIAGGQYAEVLQPIRRPRSQLLKEDELKRAVQLAFAKLRQTPAAETPNVVLVMADAEPDAACILAPRLLGWAKAAAEHVAVCCVLPNPEYETWFAAAAESLTDYVALQDGENAPTEPEKARHGKSWVQRRFKGVRYSETVDQPRLTARMDLQMCRQRSPSFDKLCRELERHRSPSQGLP